MTDVHREASSLVHSTAALRDRASKAGLSTEEIDAIVDSNVLSMAQMAFAISLQAQLLAIKMSEIFTMAGSL